MDIFGKKTKALQKLFNEFPKRIGNAYLKHFQNSFHNEGFTDATLEKWKPRKKGDKNPKKRNLLVNRGRLIKSIGLKIRGTRVIISTAVPYAKIHNEGGKISGTVSVKKHDRKTKKGKTPVKGHTRKVNITIPKRQFMGQSKQVWDELSKELTEKLSKIFPNK